jgi:predicted house-cleaning noncanonical NTP pyrophosphatase (MazG superfamily)
MRTDIMFNRVKENIMDKSRVKIYNKLVRDKIPQIIEADGKKCEIRTAGNDELIELLEAKLIEEAEEFREAKNLEELADIMEVVFGLANVLGYSEDELLEKRQEKKEERGGFEEGLVLNKVHY